jgi:hypothetical protein
MVEYFYQENPPPEQDGAGDAGSAGGKPTDAVKDQLY